MKIFNILKSGFENIANVYEAEVNGEKGFNILFNDINLWIVVKEEQVSHIHGDKIRHGEWYDILEEDLNQCKNIINNILNGEKLDVEMFVNSL